MKNNSLEIKELSVMYPNGHHALENINFTLTGGTVCALVGVNGSGKSTLFNSIMGIIKPQQGQILINNLPVKSALKNHLIAYVPQAEVIDWNFPILVRDVVMQGRYAKQNFFRSQKNIDFEKVNYAMKRLEVENLSKRQIGELSGGQRKRVFLARALAQESPVILLDEPYTGVDVHTESLIMDLLKELRQEGYLLLIATHNLGAVPLYCNETVIINKRLIAAGNVDEVYKLHNLESAFGTQLKNIGLGEINIISDDEHPAVFIDESAYK